MSDVERLSGPPLRRKIGPRQPDRAATLFTSRSWVGGVVAALTCGSLAAFWTATAQPRPTTPTPRPLGTLTMAIRTPGKADLSAVKATAPALVPATSVLPVAGPVLPDETSTPLSLGPPNSSIDGYASTATVPLARPLPLFRESDGMPVVPPEGMTTTATLAIQPSPPSAPATSAVPQTTPTVPTTRSAKKSRLDKKATTTLVPSAQPLVVPPEGLVIIAPGLTAAPPPSATAPPPANTAPATTPPANTTPGRPTGTIPFVPLTPPTAPDATPAPAPTTVAPTTIAAPTTAPTTTAAPTTIARTTSTTLVFIPLPPSTAPRVSTAASPPAPPTSPAPPTLPPVPAPSPPATPVVATPGRVPTGPLPTIDVRPVTETRTAPPLPTGTETLIPTTTPFSSEPKTFTFIGATAPAPPAHPQTALVVETAKALLGAPYVWGGEGPGYDCSGLALVAWRAAGVKLTHQSRAQFASTTRVNLADIAPGDLVFYGDPIHHLGIYIGDGKMIEAPKPGTNVRITTIKRRDLIGIGRVTG